MVGSDNAPALRTGGMSLAFVDKAEISDNLTLDYGFDFQSVSYVDRINYVSPFVRGDSSIWEPLKGAVRGGGQRRRPPNPWLLASRAARSPSQNLER